MIHAPKYSWQAYCFTSLSNLSKNFAIPVEIVAQPEFKQLHFKSWRKKERIFEKLCLLSNCSNNLKLVNPQDFRSVRSIFSLVANHVNVTLDGKRLSKPCNLLRPHQSCSGNQSSVSSSEFRYKPPVNSSTYTSCKQVYSLFSMYVQKTTYEALQLIGYYCCAFCNRWCHFFLQEKPAVVQVDVEFKIWNKTKEGWFFQKHWSLKNDEHTILKLA